MFERVPVKLKGLSESNLFMQELSIRQLRQAPKADDDGFALLMYAIECGLVNESGEKIITDEYTIEQFEDESPQSYIEELATAFEKLNAPDQASELEAAKNS